MHHTFNPDFEYLLYSLIWIPQIVTNFRHKVNQMTPRIQMALATSLQLNFIPIYFSSTINFLNMRPNMLWLESSVTIAASLALMHSTGWITFRREQQM